MADSSPAAGAAPAGSTELELTASGKKVTYVLRVDGRPQDRGEFNPNSQVGRDRLKERVGVDGPTLLGWIDEAQRDGGTRRFAVGGGTKAGTSRFVVRGGNQTRDQGDSFDVTTAEVLGTIIPALLGHQLLDWSDRDVLCCLDVDYHGVEPPPRKWLEVLVSDSLAPQPRLWHFSKSGGVHAFYEGSGPFIAQELAACAALRWRTLDPSAGVELKTQVWGPDGRECFTNPSQDTNGTLTRVLGVDESDADEVTEYVESRGWRMNSRVNHDQCPIHPTPDEGEHRQPVVVSESGVYCHLCAGKGRGLGSRRPGFAPWAAILGHPSSDEVGLMVRNLCHWGHARYVLEHRYGMPGPLARLAYKAACKAYHLGSDREAMVPLVFGEALDVIARVNDNWWCIEDCHTISRQNAKGLVDSMPAVLRLDDNAKPRVVRPTESLFNEPGSDLRRYGYPPIEVTHGYRLGSKWLTADRTLVPVPSKQIPRDRQPRWLAKDKRHPDPWAEVETVCPKIDRALVEIVLCMIGSAQEGGGMPPFLFVSGPSGSGKTQTCKVACGIVGTSADDVIYNTDHDRLRQNIQTGAERHAVLLVNEIFKEAARGRTRLSPKEALDPFLNLTADSTSHKLHTGPVPLGRVPPIVVTEPVCPSYLGAETQIARRFWHHRVFGRKTDWLARAQAVGLKDHPLIRLVSKDMAWACDSILSDVVDRFFDVPRPFGAMAETLGCHTIENDPDFEDDAEALYRLFELVCEAPEPGNERTRKVYGQGFKEVRRSDAGELVEVYSMFADGVGVDWCGSRRLTEKDWSAILKTNEPVVLDLKTDGVNAVYLRFRVGGSMKKPGRLNRECVQG